MSEGQRRPEVLCVGLTTLDVVHHVSEPASWGRKQRAVGGELLAGGPAANAAVTAARLLGAARLATAIGPAPAGGPVYADLLAHGVEVLDLAPADWSVPVASAIVDVRTGERTVVSPGALGTGGITPAEDAPLRMDGVRAVLLDGHHPALAARVAAMAAKARVPVVLDAGSWKDEMAPVLPLVGIAACSADFQPPGAPRAGDDPVASATLLHRRGVPTVLVTNGPDPVVWSTMDGASGVLPVPAVPVLDTLGAGDVFHGALACAVALGARVVPAAAEFAARVASLRCAHLGARAWLATTELDAELAGLRRLGPGVPRRLGTGVPRR